MISAVRSAIRGQFERWAVFRVVAFSGTLCGSARVAKLVDAADLKSAGGNSLPVRFRSRAPHETAARRFFVFLSAGRPSIAPRGAGAAVQNPPVVGGGSTPCRLTAADTAVWLRQAGRSCVACAVPGPPWWAGGAACRDRRYACQPHAAGVFAAKANVAIRGTLAICPFAPRACPTAQPGQTHAWPMTALGKRACGHALKPFRSSRGLA